MSDSLQDLLAEQPVEASAPCRIDCGGTWDIKAMALPLEGIGPVTVNMALNLRTSVILSPYKYGWVKISSLGFPQGEAFYKDNLPFNSRFGLFFAAVSYFGFHGLEVRIRSGSPVKSALGGSSTALVALVKALAKASAGLSGRRLRAKEVLYLSYHLEDAVSGGNCGIQDQAAAVYGGVNLWKWLYGHRTAPFARTPLLDRKGQEEFSKHLLVAFSGKSHVSSTTNRRWIKDFLSGRTRPGWVKVNETVLQLAQAIKRQNWQKAADFLREEMALRKKLTPEALIPITKKLVGQAERAGCGARFAGAGAGGSLWAIGEKKNIERLGEKWRETLETVKSAKVLDCRIDSSGVR
jgi:D-glycero-alpha-D-manno-heptose-7-phosphate kinase